jgi:hypothetical protein
LPKIKLFEKFYQVTFVFVGVLLQLLLFHFAVVVTAVVAFKAVIIVCAVLDNDATAVVFIVAFVFVDVIAVVVVADVINNPRYPMQTSDILSVPRETSS